MHPLTAKQLDTKINTFLTRKLPRYHEQQPKMRLQQLVSLVNKALIAKLL